MPLLFVDYDQGASGEWFCSELSRSPQCHPIEYRKFDHRYKVKDIVDQEFLKPIVRWDWALAQLPNTDEQYHVIPSHRHVEDINRYLPAAQVLRIAMPKDPALLLFLKFQRIVKVLLAQEPNDAYFFGLVKLYRDKYQNHDFVKHVRRDMDNLSLILLAKNVTPTVQTRFEFLSDFLNKPMMPEPSGSIDLLVRYEDLFGNIAAVEAQLDHAFGIQIKLNNQNILTSYQTFCDEFANNDQQALALDLASRC